MLIQLMSMMARELPGLLADAVPGDHAFLQRDARAGDDHSASACIRANLDPAQMNVERLWLQLGECRVNLHRIHNCSTALRHPHPWPSAVYVLTGEYRMGLGRVGSDEPVATVLMRKGSAYEMLDPLGWHYVQPLGKPSFSIMLTGRPWVPGAGGQLVQQAGKGVRHAPLPDHVREGMVNVFRDLLKDWSNSPV